MRIWVFSDLHIEVNGDFELAIPEADVAVIPGDLNSPLHAGIEWLAAHVAPAMPVVYVAGNHEFYKDSFAGGLRRGRQAVEKHPNIHLLDNSTVVIQGVRFVGGTLWTDYALQATVDRQRNKDIAQAMQNADGYLLDHRVILVEDGRALRWHPRHALEQHRRTRAMIDGVLRQPFAGETVVVTHHAPHPGSIHQRFADHPLNPAFVTDLSGIIVELQPAAWIHGHVHNGVDYRVGEKTRVICNPHGYGSENPDFDPSLVVEL